MTADTSTGPSAAGAPDRYREFRMPDVGEGLTEAEILKWYVQPGDAVTDGQVVCEVETAKAAVELPIPYDGVVHELRFEEGTTVDVGVSIITVDVAPGSGEPAEAAPAGPSLPAAAEGPAAEEPTGRQPVLVGYGVAEASTKRRPRRGASVPEQASASVSAAAAAAIQAELNGRATPVVGAPSGGRPLAKPPVRKLAKDLGVDLTTVTPSGQDGIITREDVYAAVAPTEQVREPLPATVPVTAAAAAGG
ncbi:MULTISPECIES: biotin/lipoyl-containing protein, partial [unclassified Streptomyces]|uniref:biotin/lipoyl-containing protein n=1 Tax=unclassified Streptomyces TaxID=2593676 RepID=UPI00081E2C29